MSSSFEKINYSLRPNKCIERKMMCEALGRLSFLEHIHKYRYIGFGSPYFSDFILFHKSLGLKDLISIEKEETKKERFEFNVPFAGIEMRFGRSETVLPNLELDKKKNILWLDYDDKISDFMFNDIETFFFNSAPGSFFILSLNVEQDFMPEIQENQEQRITLKEFRLKEILDRVSRRIYPDEFMDVNLNTKNLTNVCYEMIKRRIDSTLLNRNGISENKISYKQVFNFTYKDNATILTIGGIIYDNTQESKVDKMAFENFAFFAGGSDSYKIQSPNLTFREIKALDKALPDNLEKLRNGQFKNQILRSIPLIHDDISNYAKIYRYFPNFAEANL